MYSPSVTRSSIATTWGIGGFTTPQQPTYPPCTSQTIASTLGNPQMPSDYLNSRAPMGYNFRMAGTTFPFVYKRKPEDELYDSRPIAKQHITEEKVSAHLNSLHLSEKYHDHKLGKKIKESDYSKDEVIDDDPECLELSQSSKKSSSSKSSSITFSPSTIDISGPQSGRLVISDEVNRIIPGEKQLPESLLKKLIKPKMELVLWSPPGDVIRNIITSSVTSEESSSESTSQGTISNTADTSFTDPVDGSDSTEMPALSDRSMSDSSNGSSPDSGVSLSSPSSPPPSLSFLASSGSKSEASRNSGSFDDDLFSLPSTSGLTRSQTSAASLARPASPIPEPMMEDDFSERMEFNNNNGNALNFMWLEENNNSALIDLNALERQGESYLANLPDLPDDDDMDL